MARRSFAFLLSSLLPFLCVTQGFSELVDNGDGTVTETGTGLMWTQYVSQAPMKWDDALSYCATLACAGYADWRLPNKNELRSIVDFTRQDPTIDLQFFPGTRSANFWSSTTSAFMPRYAWCVHFGNGIGCPSGKSALRYVRPVRSSGLASSIAAAAGAEVAQGMWVTPTAARTPREALEPRWMPTPAWGEGLPGLEVIGEGAFPRFSPDGSLITFTREIDNEQFEVFTMRPDGTNVRCLTCDQPALADTRWKGQSSWHPSGDYLVFTAETDEHPRFLTGTSTRPGIGRNHDVWIMQSDGSRFWRVTDYPENWGAIRPVFSGDGEMLLWNEEFSMELYPEGKRRDLKIADDPADTVGHAGSYWGHLSLVYRVGEETGAWRIKLADLSFPGGEPAVSNLRDIEPPPGFTLIEAAGFTPFDDGMIGSYANLAENRGRSFWGDIFVTDLNGNIRQRFTSTPFEHDENPVFSPDGRFVLWNIATEGMSSRGEELWILNLENGRKTRLTYFTEPGHAEYNPIAGQITEISWDPSGRQAVFGHVSQAEPGTAHLPSVLYLITFW